jgi:predicted transcriptional regulator
LEPYVVAKVKQKNPTIRISARTHEVVKQLAEETRTSMADVVAEAIKQYERKLFHERAGAIWREMMKDPEERAYWEREDREIEMTFWTPIKEPWEEYDADSEEDSGCHKSEG